MKNLTEKSKVESYLKNLAEIEDFTAETLMDMSVYDMLGNSDLEGISKKALSEALDSFKREFKLKKSVEESQIPAEQTKEEELIPATHVKEDELIPAEPAKEEGQIPAKRTKKEILIPAKYTKKKRVTIFLTKIVEKPEFKVDDLTNLTVLNLFGNPELEGIGKTTLSESINAFKKKYLKIQYSNESEQSYFETSNSSNSKDFKSNQGNEVTTDLEVDKLENHEPLAPIEKEVPKEESFENISKNKNEIVVKRKPAMQQKVGDTSFSALTSDEIATIKKMIDQFKAGKMNTVSPMNFELVTLKHALQHFGFDYKTMLEKYRKNVE